MFRSLALLAAVPALATLASAQCFISSYGTLLGLGDDVVFGTVPMNITFPMGTNAFTHATVSTNGVVWLSTGTATGTTASGYPTQATFAGAAGTSARVSPMWTDLEIVAANGAGVYYNDTIPGKFVVTWSNAWEWATTSPIFNVQMQLFANGDVVFTYGALAQTTGADSSTGVSEGNGIAPQPDVNLSAGGNVSATLYMRELMVAGTFDLGGQTVTFLPAGGGYAQTVGSCVGAYHQPYGAGCYDLSDSFYQFLTDSSTAPATLNGQSMTLTPAGLVYVVQWGGGTYIPPGAGAITLTISDDSEFAQTPSIPFYSPSGPVSPLFIHGNGMVSHASNNGIQPINYVPDVNGFLNAPATGFFSWHDYNTSEPGSGQIKYEEITVGSDTVALITWDGVESYSNPTVANPSTLQFQLNLSQGIVKIVWVNVDGNPSSVYGSAHLIGWGPIGASANGGNLNLATALPLVTNAVNVNAIAMTAAPAPVSTAVSGTTVTYSTTNMPQYAPAVPVYIGANILSVSGIPVPGLDLAILGAPGCRAYVGTLDYVQTMVGGPSNSVTFAIPAGIPAGTIVYSQSIGLVQPGSLPNGQNAFGLVTSNGVLTNIAPF
ncbi:MAG: hypothetical protein WAT39_04070 [Planctomycetota bacterium]